MDTLTHGLTGALAGRALAGTGARVTPAAAGWTALAAAMFPDADFLIALADPYAYLTLHRAWTHSLLLLPLWAVLVAWVAARMSCGRYRWRELAPYAALGLATHLVSDLFNIWELKLLWPLSEAGVVFPVLFIIDPWYSGLLLIGLALSLRWRVRAGAIAGFVLVALYTAAQFPLAASAKERALARADAPQGEVNVYALPYSPFMRRVVVSDEAGHHWVHIDLASRREADPPDWDSVVHPLAAGGLSAEAWRREEMWRFREFAQLPYLYRQEGGCAWFADLQYKAPGMEPPFRWGLCREGPDAWSLDRKGRW